MTLREILEEAFVGKDAQEIRAFLSNGGHVGTPVDASSCPVARYCAAKGCPATICTTGGTSTLEDSDETLAWGPHGELDNPDRPYVRGLDGLSQFIHNFDACLYPELVAAR